MNKRIRELARQAGLNFGTNISGIELVYGTFEGSVISHIDSEELTKFAELIVGECINKIETHQIPAGNSAAGEMACEWTYAALKQIRDEIKQHFGVEE